MKTSRRAAQLLAGSIMTAVVVIGGAGVASAEQCTVDASPTATLAQDSTSSSCLAASDDGRAQGDNLVSIEATNDSSTDFVATSSKHATPGSADQLLIGDGNKANPVAAPVKVDLELVLLNDVSGGSCEC
jgi:hypothetical protein